MTKEAAGKTGARRARWLWLLPVLLLAAALAVLFLTNPDKAADPAPTLVEEESFFSDFAVEGDHVYFLCRLTIRNPTDTPMPVKITGAVPIDAESGLILGQNALGLDALRLDDGTGADFLALDATEQETIVRDRSRLLFLLQPGDNTFWAVFSGLHGETSVKQDRLLPQIYFSPLVDVTPEEVSAAMDCRIFKDPDECDAFLLDGEEIFALGFGFGGYGFTSAVPFDYGFNEVPDLLFTYSWGSGMHRSHLALFDRTSRETQELYVYYPNGVLGGSDLLVELEPDGYPTVVYTADVTVNGENFADLRFTKRAKAGIVVGVLYEEESLSGPRFLPEGTYLDFAGPTLSPDAPEQEGFGCEAEIGGETSWLEGETAAELYRICLDAVAQSELIPHPSIPAFDAWLPLQLTFRVSLPADAPEKPGAYDYYRAFWYGTFQVYYDVDDDLAYFDPNPYASTAYWYRFPAGTYDALIAVLTRDGKALVVTYLAGEDYHEVTETIPLPEDFDP